MAKARKTALKNRLAVGVDRGGTHIRMVLINGLGAELERAVMPSGSFRLLPGLILRTAAAWGLKPDVPAVIATRGAMTRKWRKPFLLKKLKGKIGLVDVISDAEAAYLAAHGRRCGALLIAGTGSVLFLKRAGNSSRNVFRKIGGDNPPGGDPGSGLWLGNRFLAMVGRKKAGLDRRSRAALARTVLERAGSGDPAALGLMRQAQESLAELLAKAAAGHRGPDALRVALAGGLMSNSFFRRTFIRLARERLAPLRMSLTGLKRPAELAAAELAMKRGNECLK